VNQSVLLTLLALLWGWRVKILKGEMTAIGKDHKVDHSAI